MACILSADSRAEDSVPLKPQNIMAVVVLALFVAHGLWLKETYVLAEVFYKAQDIELANIADVENILKVYPGAQFGVSDERLLLR
jgi:hypothetical protein